MGFMLYFLLKGLASWLNFREHISTFWLLEIPDLFNTKSNILSWGEGVELVVNLQKDNYYDQDIMSKEAVTYALTFEYIQKKKAYSIQIIQLSSTKVRHERISYVQWAYDYNSLYTLNVHP
jgi:hypothetical protein